MKNIFYYSIVFLLFPAATIAQETNETDSFVGNDSRINEAIVRQISGFEQASLKGRELLFYQSGNYNVLNVSLQGFGNSVVGGQNGNDNNIGLNARTYNSQYWLEQSGDNNQMDLTNIAGTNINFRVAQFENNNSLTIDGGGYQQFSTLKIEQSGGMKIQIQSNVFPLK
jgi:hypothetical protein